MSLSRRCRRYVACLRSALSKRKARPSQLDPAIKTKIGLPNFPAYLFYRKDYFGRPFSELTQQVMRGPSSWSVGEKAGRRLLKKGYL